MKHMWQNLMRRDWDALARANSRYYVFTSDDFRDPHKGDDERFFATGRVDVDDVLAALHVAPNPGWSVLDIGCGPGRLTRRLNELFGSATGVDVSGEMIAKAQALNPHVQFLQTSGSDLREFHDTQFDLVFSFIVLQHLPRRGLVFAYLSEIARVLKPEGLALIQIPTSFYPRWKRLYWSIGRTRHSDRNRERRSFRGTCLSAGEVQRHVAALGLIPEVVLYEGTGYTYFRLAKLGVDSLFSQQRSAGQSRPELARLVA
jgi:SAM-dependent methyltransferase